MLHKEELVKLFFEKSDSAIKSAKDNIKLSNLETAQNRIYYAIFYVVSALAYKNNFVTSKHNQLMGWFNKKFIYDEKIFDEKMIDIYKEAFSKRQRSDYDFFFSTDVQTSKKSLEEAIFFVEKIKQFLQY